MTSLPFQVPGLPGARLSSRHAPTNVDLLWVEKRLEHWICFGRQAGETIHSRASRTVSFLPNTIFALVRWTANDFGTVRSRIDVLRAVAPGEDYTTVPFVRPGGELLLSVEGWTKVSAVLTAIDVVDAAGVDPQQRGYLLEDLLNRIFDLCGIPVHSTFKRNAGGEQIDGAFELDGWHYIVECRWRQRLPDIRQLDGLSGQIRRSGRQTMGMFLSVEGWSENVIPLLKQNPDKSIILMDGFDFRSVLDQRVGLEALLRAKVKALNFQAEPFMSVFQLI